jgi:outer-membrane receptor for ferric coprogen and ferric-rhodotorulic acid
MDKPVFYGVVDADLSRSTLLTIGGSYEKRNVTGAYTGVPRYIPGADLELPREDCLCTDWSTRSYQTRELFLTLEQTAGEHWTFKVNVTREHQKYALKLGNVTGAVNPITGAGPLLAGRRTDVSNRATLVDVTVDGRFTALGMKHEVLLGGNLQDMFSRGTGVSLYPCSQRPTSSSSTPRAFRNRALRQPIGRCFRLAGRSRRAPTRRCVPT